MSLAMVRGDDLNIGSSHVTMIREKQHGLFQLYRPKCWSKLVAYVNKSKSEPMVVVCPFFLKISQSQRETF